MPDSLFDKINALWKRKENYIATKQSNLAKDVDKSASMLLSQLLSDYLGNFDTKDGLLLSNNHNMILVNQLEKQFDKFERVLKPLNTKYGQDIIKSGIFSEQYYSAFPGIAEQVLEAATENISIVETMLGIKGDKIIKGSYLDGLSRVPEVREKIKRYVMQNVAGNANYASYLKGMKDMIVGNDEVTGSLQKYYRQYAYDTFNNVDAAINKQFAKAAGFKYFIYHGSIIDTSRPFCKKRAGKVFSVLETKKWKNDSTLLGDPGTYRPLIERGRWNCRHSIKYISDVLAFKLRPGLKKGRKIR